MLTKGTPAGWTPEEIDALIEERARQKRNEYNARHPEKVLQHRITASINLLTKHGYSVSGPIKNMEGAGT